MCLLVGSQGLRIVVDKAVKIEAKVLAHPQPAAYKHKEKIMDGVTIALIVVALLIIPSSNKKLNERCEAEVEQGIAESVRECRNYYINKK